MTLCRRTSETLRVSVQIPMQALPHAGRAFGSRPAGERKGGVWRHAAGRQGPPGVCAGAPRGPRGPPAHAERRGGTHGARSERTAGRQQVHLMLVHPWKILRLTLVGGGSSKLYLLQPHSHGRVDMGECLSTSPRVGMGRLQYLCKQSLSALGSWVTTCRDLL